MSNLKEIKLFFPKFKPGVTRYSRALVPGDSDYEPGMYAILLPDCDSKFKMKRVPGGVVISGTGFICTDLERIDLMDAYRRSPKSREDAEHIWVE